MARQNINTGVTANDGTGDTLRIAGGKINDNFTELYTLLGGDSAQITQNVSLADSGVVYNGLIHDTVLGFQEGGSKSTILLPSESGTITLNTATQTLTNKTLTAPVMTAPQINDTSADHQYIFAPSELVADRTITLPLLTSDDEFVFKAYSQILTNKTLTEPTVARPIIQGHIEDSAGNKVIDLTSSASAVNTINITNAATGGIPQVAATGDDTNIGLGLSGTNAGLVHIQSGVRYRTETISSTGQSINLARPVTIFNAGGSIAATLGNGSFVGEQKTLSNIGTGEVTITPTTFKNGTTLHLRADALVNCMWIDATDGWLIMSPKVYTSGDADALFYVTA